MRIESTNSRLNFIIDANVNRFKEGARVLEDIARFVFKNEQLFFKIKHIKHSVRLQRPYRESNSDCGDSRYKENHNRCSLYDIIQANAIRMQEAARSLEEVSQNHKYKQLRFEAYELHDLLINNLDKYLRLSHLSGLYAICDPSMHSLVQIEQVLYKHSIKICQLRTKQLEKAEIVNYASKLKKICQANNCLLIINDHIDIALAYGDGVHLGQTDFPLPECKKIVPDNFVIGITCRTLCQSRAAESLGATYISVGAFQPTSTKVNAELTSIKTLKTIVESITIPICVIGGIKQDTADYYYKIGANMIAMQQSLFSI